MKNEPDRLTLPTPTNGATLYRYYALTVLACLFALMSACTASRESTKGQKLRLSVGEIKEVNLATRADTTWQITATSDNQEVVDITRKPPIATTGNGTNTLPTGLAVFLIKGVTIGTAQVVFSEKQMGADGTGRVKKTYRVTVVSK